MTLKMTSKFVGMHSAIALAERCIKESAFVEVTPLPGDLYVVSVKQDAVHLLRTRYNVLLQNRGVAIERGIFAITLVEAAEKVRDEASRVCYVGSHEVVAGDFSGPNEYVDMDDDLNNGFLIWPVRHGSKVVAYRADEWIKGGVVSTHTGSYEAVRRWISQGHPSHWGLRFDLQALCGLWKEFLETQLDAAGERLAEEFLFFPIGARVSDVARLFEEANPDFQQAKKEMFGT